MLRDDVCKLQKKAILDFFIAQRGTDKMGVVFTQVAKADEGLKNNDDREYERLIDTIIPYFISDKFPCRGCSPGRLCW